MKSPFKRRAVPRRRQRRLGVEIVELALALPVMVVVIFGTLETCEMLFMKQSLALATYEAGRVAGRPEADAAAVQSRFDQIIAARRINNATITITPADLGSVATGETIRIQATAPVGGNNSTNLVLSSLPDVVETVAVMRE